MEREVHCHLTIWMGFLVVASRLFYLLLFVDVVICMMAHLTILFPSVVGISCLSVFCPFVVGFVCFFACLCFPLALLLD